MKLKLRKYQKEALDYALKEKNSVLVLPTGTGKTIIGLSFVKEILEKDPRSKALILVPTRILVEQTDRVYRKYGLESIKIYGVINREKRKELWNKAKIVVATPETVYNDLEFVRDFNIVVVDECHHAIGEDTYVKVLRKLKPEYSLGLSAHIPKRRKREIETLIGKIKEWSVKDSDIDRYIPVWIGDIYEANFNDFELKVYRTIERRRLKAKKFEKLIYTLALKYLASDGALALKDSLKRKSKLSELLSEFRKDIEYLRDLHKIDTLNKIFQIYDDFEKAIIFVDRVVVAKKIYEIFSEIYPSVLIVGRLREKMKEVLEEAKEARLIISTSAGEEGVDLPTSDLLVIWSQTSSPLRFIQRHGRIMRRIEKLKFATFIITPDTIDTDLFLMGLEYTRKYIDLGTMNILYEKVFKKSGFSKILGVLTSPLPEEWIKEITGRTSREVRLALNFGLRNKQIVYFYTPIGKAYIRKEYSETVKEKFPESFTPKHYGKVKIKAGSRFRTIQGNYRELFKKLKNKLPLSKLEITVIKKEEIEEYDFRKYNYEIDDEDLLKLVLENALS